MQVADNLHAVIALGEALRAGCEAFYANRCTCRGFSMCICKRSNQVKLLKVCINTDSDDTAADNLDYLSDMMTL